MRTFLYKAVHVLPACLDPHRLNTQSIVVKWLWYSWLQYERLIRNKKIPALNLAQGFRTHRNLYLT